MPREGGSGGWGGAGAGAGLSHLSGLAKRQVKKQSKLKVSTRRSSEMTTVRTVPSVADGRAISGTGVPQGVATTPRYSSLRCWTPGLWVDGPELALTSRLIFRDY